MTANLRRFLDAGRMLAVPGASDALSARMIEAHGHPCVYIGSYATAASSSSDKRPVSGNP